MVSVSSSGKLFKLISILFLLYNMTCQAQLSATFYYKTCPNALPTIRKSIRQAVTRERRMAASIIRLLFHDCFVQGCDASLLLDETPTIQSEKTAFPNINSVRGFEVIEAAKSAVEAICPGVVSCADVLAVAARDSSVLVGGPSWEVKLGRRDSTTANRAEANTDLPPPTSNLSVLIARFANKGLNERDMVALSGAHTIGFARCVAFRARIYSNGTEPIDPGFASTRRQGCPRSGGDNNLAPLDLVTPRTFDNNYFKNLLQLKGLLHSDQVLFNGGSADSIVAGYTRNPKTFDSDFASAMVKMSDISPLLGRNGIIRTVCSAIN